MNTKDKPKTSMTTENRRKEDKTEAQTRDPRRNLTPLSSSAMVDKAEKEPPILPSDEKLHIPTIESVVDTRNIQEAMKAVIRNQGAPGVDGMTTEEIKEVMRKAWPQIKDEILEGKYRPRPVKKVEIPKPDGKGVRQLGIPTLMDRIIQQALHQVLAPVFEPLFSPNSYGFRPQRSAHQAGV